MAEQFLRENELNTIKGFVRYLNATPQGDLDFEVAIGDSNGDEVGRITRRDGQYVFVYGMPS